MDTYKLILLIIFSNLAVSAIVSAGAAPELSWQHFLSDSITTGIANGGTSMQTTYQGDISGSQPTGVLEYGGGVNLITITWAVIGLFDALFGGLITVANILVVLVSASGVLSILAWMLLLYFTMLYTWAGIEVFLLVKNKKAP